MPTPDPTLPIRDLPEEIETAMHRLVVAAYGAGEGRLDLPDNGVERKEALRQAIRAALDDQDAALREELTRLQKIEDDARLLTDFALRQGATGSIVIDGAIQRLGANISSGLKLRLADNLRPRGGGER